MCLLQEYIPINRENIPTKHISAPIHRYIPPIRRTSEHGVPDTHTWIHSHQPGEHPDMACPNARHPYMDTSPSIGRSSEHGVSQHRPMNTFPSRENIHAMIRGPVFPTVNTFPTWEDIYMQYTNATHHAHHRGLTTHKQILAHGQRHPVPDRSIMAHWPNGNPCLSHHNVDQWL